MPITHDEAQGLIQLKVDNSLRLTDEEKLSAHLKSCTECRLYLETTKVTEAILRKTLRKQWRTAAPLPLQMDIIYEKVGFGGSASILVTTRTALIGVAFMVFAFMAWQSMNTDSLVQQNLPGIVPLIPTPSTQYTATITLQSECQNFKYSVHEGDTLENIARQFSVSEESIVIANNLTDESLGSIQELVIQVCETTPTSTTNPPTFTITPIFEPVSTTPG